MRRTHGGCRNERADRRSPPIAGACCAGPAPSPSPCRCCPVWPAARRAAGKPTRFVTFFFGNGMPPAYSRPVSQSPVLAPLAPHAAKIALVRGIANRSASGGSGHPHARGSSTFAIGYANPSVRDRRGRSRWTSPPTRPGSHRRRCRRWPPRCGGGRRTSSATPTPGRAPGKPNPGITRPLALFHRMFGGSRDDRPRRQPRGGQGAQAAPLSSQRARFGAGRLQDASPARRRGLSAPVRSTLSNHFESVRSLERRAIAIEQRMGTPGAGGAMCRPWSPRPTCRRSRPAARAATPRAAPAPTTPAAAPTSRPTGIRSGR